jgi:hypothetical protein
MITGAAKGLSMPDRAMLSAWFVIAAGQMKSQST